MWLASGSGRTKNTLPPTDLFGQSALLTDHLWWVRFGMQRRHWVCVCVCVRATFSQIFSTHSRTDAAQCHHEPLTHRMQFWNDLRTTRLCNSTTNQSIDIVVWPHSEWTSACCWNSLVANTETFGPYNQCRCLWEMWLRRHWFLSWSFPSKTNDWIWDGNFILDKSLFDKTWGCGVQRSVPCCWEA